ncbi:MAG: alpha/beta fold hydrolase [Anaerolineae bacterium]|jgi:pimeloyl-ACP methyl ester carboxylesterase|nr:alpha/beta fold hydrolase [Anaerolineae bacterium]MBT7075012.1 alpha/beta fold hydrolase [Anaerolineae bacterium]MBT7782947.1 alpha/beta fold hydrolase [Anaerolineae bacterium]
MNKTTWIFLSIATLALLLVACGGGKTPQIDLDEATAGDAQLEPCTVKLDSEEYAADCGLLAVPENRTDAESRLISLPITRIRATGENPAEPIFYLEGGPGMSNMRAKPPVKLLEKHDFIMVGYRGVDGSVRLDCPEVAEAIKGDGIDVLSEASQAGMSAAMRQCAARLQSEGVDLDGYTIQEVIEDMEAARNALGYQQVNLFSNSYGTRVAQLYANQHPEQIHRSIMIGVNPPGHFVWEPDMVDAQIGHYAQLYAETENPHTSDLAKMMSEISHDMPKRWLFFKIDPGKVKSVSFAMLFHRNTAAMVFDTWLAAENGDASGLALMSLAYDFIIPNMSVYGEFFSKGVSADYDPNRDYFADMEPPDSIIGAPMSKLIWGSATDDAGVTWPTALMPAEYRQVQSSEVETLLVNGNVDFSTPVEYASDALLPKLKNGALVTLSEMGHIGDVMTIQPEATERLIAHFFDTGEVDDSLFTYEAMDFQVKTGFPEFAKIALGISLLGVPLIILGIWKLLQRIQLKRNKKA